MKLGELIYFSESDNEYEWGYESSPEFGLYSHLRRNESEPYGMHRVSSYHAVMTSNLTLPRIFKNALKS